MTVDVELNNLFCCYPAISCYIYNVYDVFACVCSIVKVEKKGLLKEKHEEIVKQIYFF